MEPTGTLVVWSDLDRVRWRGGYTTLRKTEEHCGRLYRKFLAAGSDRIEIRLTLGTADDDGRVTVNEEPRQCRPNDPLYLTTPSSTPEPFCNEPMFETFNERTWTVSVKGEVAEIRIRCTMARPDAINEKRSSIPWPKSYVQAGRAPWGKHADRNKGVSIVRAGRELELSQAWVNSYEPEERWWSVEVEFDPLLDDIFGVVNNKQHAHAFARGAGFNWEDEKETGESFQAFCDRLRESSDPRSIWWRYGRG